MIYVSMLMMFDYLFTYVGVTLGITYEANPLMVWLFDYSLLKGILFRLFMISVIMCMLSYIKIKRYSAYQKLIVFALVVNIVILFFHLRWISTL